MAKNQKEEILTGQEKVDRYLNLWGSDKRTLISILRQLIFLFGVISTSIVGIWVVTHAISFAVGDVFKTITDRIAKISIVFITFMIALNIIYLFAEIYSMNENRKNRIPSMVLGGALLIALTVFLVLSCVELFGPNKAARSYIYCIYLVICFSICLFSTIFCFDAKQKNVKFNPNLKLIKTLGYTTGFLGIFAVLSFILWIMWYGNSDTNLQWTSFILARTTITLIGCIAVSIICQLVLFGVMRYVSPNRRRRVIYLSILFAILLGLDIALGYCFLLNGVWLTNTALCRGLMSVTIVFVIIVSAINIAIASRYATHLEKGIK